MLTNHTFGTNLEAALNGSKRFCGFCYNGSKQFRAALYDLSEAALNYLGLQLFGTI